MKALASLWLVIFAVLALFLVSGCHKDSPCLQDETFCSLVHAQDFDGTGPVINQFLETLNANDSQALEELVAWLECKNCVSSSFILCNSCIYTLLPQSEIEVTFMNGSDTTTMTMDIVMDDPLRFVRYH